MDALLLKTRRLEGILARLAAHTSEGAEESELIVQLGALLSRSTTLAESLETLMSCRSPLSLRSHQEPASPPLPPQPPATPQVHRNKLCRTMAMSPETASAEDLPLDSWRSNLPVDLQRGSFSLARVSAANGDQLAFYVILQAAIRPLQALNKTLQESAKRQAAALPSSQLRQGRVVLAPYQGRFYRAALLHVAEEDCLVYFVDYGNQAYVPRNQVLLLKAKYTGTPALGIPCRVAGVDERHLEAPLRARFAKDFPEQTPLALEPLSLRPNARRPGGVELVVELRSPLPPHGALSAKYATPEREERMGRSERRAARRQPSPSPPSSDPPSSPDVREEASPAPLRHDIATTHTECASPSSRGAHHASEGRAPGTGGHQSSAQDLYGFQSRRDQVSNKAEGPSGNGPSGHGREPSLAKKYQFKTVPLASEEGEPEEDAPFPHGFASVQLQQSSDSGPRQLVLSSADEWGVGIDVPEEPAE